AWGWTPRPASGCSPNCWLPSPYPSTHPVNREATVIEMLWWSFVLRAAQAVVEASPTLLSGVLIAGVVRRMVGPDANRKLFGGAGARGLLRSWALGVLLPVCSLGVIPVLRELRRSGVSGGNVLAFALAAPLLNPISFLYGLTLAEPRAVFAYVGASLVL